MSHSNGKSLAYIPVKMIRPNPAALREVDRAGVKYKEMYESVKSEGVIKPILVSPLTKDSQTGEEYYGLSDGLHRFTSSQDLGLETIPAHIIPMDEAKRLLLQFIGNAHFIDTKPAEFASGLIRILGAHPSMTMKELADLIKKNPITLGKMLSLGDLKKDLQTLVDEDKIPVVNAYALAKLDEAEQENWKDRAQTEKPDVFVPAVTQRAKDLRDARRKGQKPAAEAFTPHPHLHTVGEMKAELEFKTVAQLFKDQNIVGSVEDFAMGVAWVLHMDPPSVAAAREKWQNKANEKAMEKNKSKEEKEKQRLDEAKAELIKLGIVVPVGA